MNIFTSTILTKTFILIICTNSCFAIFEYDRAIRQSQKNNWQQAEQMLTQVIIENPNKPDALYDLGVAAYKNNNFDIALNYFNKAASHTMANSMLQQHAHFNAGNAHVQLQQLQEAIDAYDKVLALKPDHKEALHNKEMVKKMMEQSADDKSMADKQKQNQQDKDKQKNNKSEENKEDFSEDQKEQDSQNEQNEDKKQNQRQNKNEKDNKDQSADANQSSSKDSDGQESGVDRQQKDKHNKQNQHDNDQRKDQELNKKENKSDKPDQTNADKSKDSSDAKTMADKKNEESEQSGNQQNQQSSDPQSARPEGIEDASRRMTDKKLSKGLARALEEQEKKDAQLNKKMTKALVANQGGGKNDYNCW